MEHKYWKSINEKNPEAGFMPESTEISDPASMIEILADAANEKTSSRRDFLKWCGISFVSATVLSACENPVKKAIPYLNQPEELTPGKASWYASTYLKGNEYCPVLVKVRDGRPIKIEGNELSSLSRGGTSARVQASVLSLYDSGARYHNPMRNQKTVSWQEADQEIMKQLRQLSDNGDRMVLLSPSVLSPSTQSLIDRFSELWPGFEHIVHDPISYSAMRRAHEETFSWPAIPMPRFDKARLIVSFGADFLGTWLSPITFAGQYAQTRDPESEQGMSHHIQIESQLSLSGANADKRIPAKPDQEILMLISLHDELASLNGLPRLGNDSQNSEMQSLAAEIMKYRGQSLVVCGHDDINMQKLVCAINHMAGSYGHTLETEKPVTASQGNQEKVDNLLADLKSGRIGAILFHGSNPVYDHRSNEWEEAISRCPLSISFASSLDETSSLCQWILPDHHYLESWNDACFTQGSLSLCQPVIHPIFKTRQMQNSLLTWMGYQRDYLSWMREHWKEKYYPEQSVYIDFDSFWTFSLQSGVFEYSYRAAQLMPPDQTAIQRAHSGLARQTHEAGKLQFSLFSHLAMADGSDANNPWLQEMPEPQSSVTWDNYAAVAPKTAAELGLRDGELIRINGVLEIPVLVQPGQAADCLSMALGYGRTKAGKVGSYTGSNTFRLAAGLPEYSAMRGYIEHWEKTGKQIDFARTQSHFSMEGRDIVRESDWAAWKQNPSAGNELRAYHEKHKISLYPPGEYAGHHWALLVDLNKCTGCSSCVIACQSENNTPVVGREEVRRRRIMHWMRIDRYYNGEPDNPQVVFQPLMCQHCDHAPCENVCPVAATTHSSEGLNQMTYNRCVGTKYCINNCPYKVRRFNWFEYAKKESFNAQTATELGRMVLNPDVTVRERGVVEKCSFCVQRIQDAKLTAKTEGRKLRDGEIRTACMQACPSGALVFGDLNDKESAVSRLIKNPRNYHLLEELHTLPSTGYLTKIRNT